VLSFSGIALNPHALSAGWLHDVRDTRSEPFVTSTGSFGLGALDLPRITLEFSSLEIASIVVVHVLPWSRGRVVYSERNALPKDILNEESQPRSGSYQSFSARRSLSDYSENTRAINFRKMSNTPELWIKVINNGLQSRDQMELRVACTDLLQSQVHFEMAQLSRGIGGDIAKWVLDDICRQRKIHLHISPLHLAIRHAGEATTTQTGGPSQLRAGISRTHHCLHRPKYGGHQPAWRGLP